MYQDKIEINLGLKMDNFERNLRQIINKFGVDSGLGVPDFVLAQVINEMLEKAEEQGSAKIPVTAAELIVVRRKVIATLMSALSDMSMVD